MKQKLLFFFLGMAISSIAQNRNRFFYGKIIDATDTIRNAHIINLKTKQGAFSNDKGLFTISAEKNDSLKISAIGFKTLFFVIQEFHFKEHKNIIILEEEIYNLDEIVIKKHNLTGSLSLDIKKIQTTYQEKAVKNLMEGLLNLNFYEISKMGISRNETHLSKAAIVRLPGNRFVGFGITSGTSGTSNASSFSKELEEEKKIPDKILSELGPDFFFTELKIPKDKYYHFITYCSFKNIFELFKNKKTFKLITILRQESKPYLEIIKNKE